MTRTVTSRRTVPYYVRSGYVQETIVSAMRLLTGRCRCRFLWIGLGLRR